MCLSVLSACCFLEATDGLLCVVARVACGVALFLCRLWRLAQVDTLESRQGRITGTAQTGEQLLLAPCM
jgi:hypothetical protein